MIVKCFLAPTIVKSSRELPLFSRFMRLRFKYHRLDDFEVIWIDFIFLYYHVLDSLQRLPTLLLGFRFEGICQNEMENERKKEKSFPIEHQISDFNAEGNKIDC